MGTTNNGARFLDAYNRIDYVLRERHTVASRADEYVGFTKLVSQSKDLVPAQKERLRAFAKLRNVIVHSSSDGSEQVIADPRNSAVDWLERQADIIENPPLVRNVLELGPPVVLDEDDDLDAFLQMVKPPVNFSQAPIRRADGSLALITTNVVARWVAQSYIKGDGVIIDHTNLRQIGELAEEEDRVVLRSRGLRAVDAVRVFAGEGRQPAPAAIVLTESGKDSEKPLGICVRFDVARLMAALGV